MNARIVSLGLATFQDNGRTGHTRVGVPGAGPADRRAFLEANWLVGDKGRTVIEFVGALTVVAETPLVVAHTGSEADVAVNGYLAPSRATIHLMAGDTLTIGSARAGIYGYLSTPGGWDTDLILGSASTDTLSGLGPKPLTAGGILKATGAPVDPRACRGPVPTAPVALTEGPHVGLLGDAVFDSLINTTWAIGPGSSRVGLRLTGDHIDHNAPSLNSLPMLDGAIQLTPSGQPIVLGPDHGTAGGYPVIGMLTRQGINILYRLREGDPFTFTRSTAAPDAATSFDLAYV